MGSSHVRAAIQRRLGTPTHARGSSARTRHVPLHRIILKHARLIFTYIMSARMSDSISKDKARTAASDVLSIACSRQLWRLAAACRYVLLPSSSSPRPCPPPLLLLLLALSLRLILC